MTLTTADVAPKDRVVIKASRQQATVTKTTETTVTVRYREAIPGRAMMAFGRYQMVSLELPYSEIELVDELKSAHSLKGIETLARLGLEPKDVKHTPIKWEYRTSCKVEVFAFFEAVKTQGAK